jgi:hypothetical protein
MITSQQKKKKKLMIPRMNFQAHYNQLKAQKNNVNSRIIQKNVLGLGRVKIDKKIKENPYIYD